MVNAEPRDAEQCYGVSHLSIFLDANLVGMLILFTKISTFHHENPQLLCHPIKFAIVDPSTAPDCKNKLTIKAT